ncbi:hypothetical protein U9M48_002962 [Paspalum notatum var. saurae]|uniref:Uncharacterized protein n=1 Tax=Paspalum notatum var. saurae TaxID=547442 RepID=A0AAQ3PSF2_PASNO
MKGFSPLWCQWIQDFVSRRSVVVKVNNDTGWYFKTNKGQHMLAIFITRAKEDDQIHGLIPHLVDGGFSIL